MRKKPGKKLTRKPRKPRLDDFSKGYEDGKYGESPMLVSDDYMKGYKLGREARRADIIHHNHGVLNPKYPEEPAEEFK